MRTHEEALAGLHPDQRQALKRIAIQVTTLLPEDEKEALCVLEFTQELVLGFLGKVEQKPAEGGRVAEFKPRRVYRA